MKIFRETKELVKREKHYTAMILKNLMVIERDKLYSDLKYPSLYKYIIKELNYTDAEATIRVNATRLMLKSKKAAQKIVEGKLNLTNAARANKVLQNGRLAGEKVDEVVERATGSSTRKFKDFVNREFGRGRREVLVLEEYMLEKFDRLRKKYGDLPTLELVQIMLERELKDPRERAQRRGRPQLNGNRYIPAAVKRRVYTGRCANCDTRHGLEYDHIVKYSHGGGNGESNIQMLCRSCNGRKEIQARQTGHFS